MKAFLTNKTLKLAHWLWLTIFIFVAGGATAFVINMPRHAGWRYGACKAFLEQYVRFPPTIKIEEGGETSNSAVISFSDINPYGSQQIRSFECYFGSDAQGQTVLTRITIDRKALPDDVVSDFADQLPILAGQKLDTTLPKDLPDDLEDLKD